jgi:beta-glucanase (GH16 family)
MFHKFLIGLIIPALFISCTNHQQSAENNPAGSDSLLRLEDWDLLPGTGDEFTAASFDTSKWKMGLWYDVSGDFAFKNENISVRNGNLRLTAKKEKYNKKEFTIGAVESRFDIPEAPSLLRVRARLLPDTANVCSAIWLQSWPEVKNNPNPEIDIIEYFQQKEMHMNLFTWDKDSSGNYQHVDFKGQIFNYNKDLSTTFHVYGLERSGDHIRFYFDDKLVCDWKAPDPAFTSMPRHLILSLEGHRYEPHVDQLPASFDIDWVRVFIPGKKNNSPH